MLPTIFDPSLNLVAGPDRRFRLLGEDLDRFFGRHMTGSGRTAICATDVWEDQDHVYLAVDLPGLRKENVEISIDDGVLTISGERKEETPKDSDHYYIRERRITEFERRFRLPDSIDPDNVAAVLKDGVLTITLNRREELKPRTIVVEDAGS